MTSPGVCEKCSENCGSCEGTLTNCTACAELTRDFANDCVCPTGSYSSVLNGPCD